MALRTRRTSIESSPIDEPQLDTAYESPAKSVRTPMSNIKKVLNVRNIFIIAFIVVLAAFGYYFMQYQKLSKTPAQVAKEKTAALIKEISAFAVIPSDPNAQLAEVTDVSKLKDQPFFANAQNGDEILVFPSAMEAILYRPSVRKIVSISQLAPSTNTTQTATASNATTTKKK